jgi:hypothetical protein
MKDTLPFLCNITTLVIHVYNCLCSHPSTCISIHPAIHSAIYSHIHPAMYLATTLHNVCTHTHTHKHTYIKYTHALDTSSLSPATQRITVCLQVEIAQMFILCTSQYNNHHIHPYCIIIVIFSFSLTYSDLFIPTDCRWSGLLFHLITLNDASTHSHTHTHTHTHSVGFLWTRDTPLSETENLANNVIRFSDRPGRNDYTTLHYTTLHYTTLQYTTLH